MNRTTLAPCRGHLRRRFASTLLIASLWMTVPVGVLAAEPLVLVTPENTADTLISEVIVREAYRRLGIDVVIRKYPAERAIRLANEGKADGEVQRIDGIAKNYPNLIQVRPSINFISATAFSAKKDLRVDGWPSLRPYRIGIIRGIKFAERNTRGMAVAAAGDYERLFVMLDRGRFDIALSTRLNGLLHIKRLGIDGVRALDPDVDRFELYHYLHRKHADLVPRIEAMFDRMWKSGDLARIRAHVVRVMLDRAARKLDICDDDYACFEIGEGGENSSGD
jgi:hypothetical protein